MKTDCRISGETTIPKYGIIAIAEKSIVKEANRTKVLCKLAKVISPGIYILRVEEKEQETEQGINIRTTIDVSEMEEQHEETVRKSEQHTDTPKDATYQGRGENGCKAVD